MGGFSNIDPVTTPTKGGFVIKSLVDMITGAVDEADAKILQISGQGAEISIGDMFDMQMTMNRLSQLSEMSTSIVNASNTAISSMARNVKG